MGKEDREVRMSLQTLKVLEAFLENPIDQLSGAEVHQRCKLASGTLYPILLRRGGRMVRQPVGVYQSIDCWPAAAPPLSADVNRPQTRQRSVRKL